MKYIKYTAILIWRIWFYAWALGTVVVAFPLLLISLFKESWYPWFYKIGHAWGKTLLFIMGFKAKIISNQDIDTNKNLMFISNHTSTIDIMLMLAVVKNPIVFVAKKEVGDIPIVGYVFRRSSILVSHGYWPVHCIPVG